MRDIYIYTHIYIHIYTYTYIYIYIYIYVFFCPQLPPTDEPVAALTPPPCRGAVVGYRFSAFWLRQRSLFGVTRSRAFVVLIIDTWRVYCTCSSFGSGVLSGRLWHLRPWTSVVSFFFRFQFHQAKEKRDHISGKCIFICHLLGFSVFTVF